MHQVALENGAALPSACPPPQTLCALSPLIASSAWAVGAVSMAASCLRPAFSQESLYCFNSETFTYWTGQHSTRCCLSENMLHSPSQSWMWYHWITKCLSAWSTSL